MGQEGPGTVSTPPEINVHDPFEVFVGHLTDRGRQGNARVVDDQIDLTEIFHNLLRMGKDGIAIRHVQPVGFYISAA